MLRRLDAISNTDAAEFRENGGSLEVDSYRITEAEILRTAKTKSSQVMAYRGLENSKNNGSLSAFLITLILVGCETRSYICNCNIDEGKYNEYFD